jgi:glucose/mannose-6-phosphate isomerase
VSGHAGSRGGDAGPALTGLGQAEVARLDAGDMLGAIAGLSRQLVEGYAGARADLASALLPRPDGVVVCGMGGSAIGADLILAVLPQLPVPAVVARGYELPAWAGPATLVVAVSCSGDTEETLVCAEAALTRGCPTVAVASGGRLAALAEDRGAPLVRVPGSLQPRAALGWLSTAVLATFEVSRLCGPVEVDIGEAAAVLRAGGDGLGVAAGEEAGNEAKALARRLHGRLAVVYGAGATAPVARRWKTQINENAKAPAFWGELPELDHNELQGWGGLPHVTAATEVVLLEDEVGAERLRRRADLTAADLTARGAAVTRVESRGASALARVFSLVQLGDYVSFYLALLYGVDPTPVDAIQAFKRRLADGG